MSLVCFERSHRRQAVWLTPVLLSLLLLSSASTLPTFGQQPQSQFQPSPELHIVSLPYSYGHSPIFENAVGAKTAQVQSQDEKSFPNAHKDQKSTADATGHTYKNWDAIGLTFAQLINAEEKKYHAAHDRYANDFELSKSGALAKVSWKMTLKFGPDLFRKVHWTFQIETSTNGQQYVQIVHGSQECQHVFFSNQEGAVYEGKQVGCR